MSFAYDAKMEVLENKIENDCCAIAFISAVIKTAGEIDFSKNNEPKLEVVTELGNLYDRLNETIVQYYGKSLEIEKIEDSEIVKTPRYRIKFPSEIIGKILVDLGIMQVENGTLKEGKEQIANFIIADDCCKRAYVMGAFCGCATSNIKIKNYSNSEKNSSGYHLEFVFSNEKLAEEFLKLLQFFEISAKKTIRKKAPLIYIKEYQLICDALALVGASNAVLTLQNEAAIREVRNNVNRQTNCFNANLNKTVSAAVRQMKAIKIIQDNMGLENLDEPLMELAMLRLANPDESLETLRTLYSEKISKSGINHRFEKICKIADEIQKSRFKITTF